MKSDRDFYYQLFAQIKTGCHLGCLLKSAAMISMMLCFGVEEVENLRVLSNDGELELVLSSVVYE